MFGRGSVLKKVVGTRSGILSRERLILLPGAVHGSEFGSATLQEKREAEA